MTLFRWFSPMIINSLLQKYHHHHVFYLPNNTRFLTKPGISTTQQTLRSISTPNIESAVRSVFEWQPYNKEIRLLPRSNPPEIPLWAICLSGPNPAPRSVSRFSRVRWEGSAFRVGHPTLRWLDKLSCSLQEGGMFDVCLALWIHVFRKIIKQTLNICPSIWFVGAKSLLVLRMVRNDHFPSASMDAVTEVRIRRWTTRAAGLFALLRTTSKNDDGGEGVEN